ncbi:hypothetical protein [Frisingicoccus sp.]|uniref:hypothetical protein n=1 Tax=Frisingicoccus sp. TaxID=1918627 RepID=UPI0039939815
MWSIPSTVDGQGSALGSGSTPDAAALNENYKPIGSGNTSKAEVMYHGRYYGEVHQ